MTGCSVSPLFTLGKISLILVWSDAVGLDPCGSSNQTCGVILHLIRQSRGQPWLLPFEE